MRKNFTLVILSLCFCLPAIAQLDKGTKSLGGTVNIEQANTSTDNGDEVKGTIVIFRPSAGIFYRKNRLAGVKLSLSYSKYVNYTSKTHSFGGGVFLRQYLPIGSRFYVFAEETLNIQRSKSEVLPPALYKSEEKSTSAGLFFFPGLAFNVTKKFQLELSLPTLASLTYTHNKRRVYETVPAATTSTDTFRLQTGSSDTSLGDLGFGVRFLM